jgi:hypothetical protein
MKAVLRLVYSYFLATLATRALTLGGVVLCLVSVYVVTYLPQSEHMLAFAMSGQLAIFLGSAFMPLMFGRLAQGQSSRLLPGARVKLLASALLTVAIVALPTGLLTPLAYVAGVSSNASDFTRYPALWVHTVDLAWVTYTSVCIFAGWMYVIMWFITSQRSLAGVLKGMLVLVFMMLLPTRELRELSATIQWNVVQLAVAWCLFALGFLAWPRLKQRLAQRRNRAAGGTGSAVRQVSGREVSLMLGTAQPWLTIAGTVLPVVIASRLGKVDPLMWLFILSIASIVSAGVSGQAAERSRPLWLRAGWSRAELFAQVERAVLRHNGIVLLALMALALALGLFHRLPSHWLAFGLPLLALGTLCSSYLGLMITRGLRWIEMILGALLVLTLMAVAFMLATAEVNLVAVASAEVVVAVATIACRLVAGKRWSRIDWSQCRSSRLRAARIR